MSYSDISFSSGSWAGSRVLKYHSATSTHVNFALTSSDGVNFAFSNPLEGGLAVERSTNTWSDLNTSSGNFPAISSQSSSSVTLANQFGAVRAIFTKPAQSTWAQPNTNSTGTEGFSYSGTLTVNGTTLEYAIPSTASSGTYMLMSSASATPQLSIVHGTGSSTGSAPNFDQTKIWTLLSPTEDELARIDLRRRKVCCNFW